MNGTLLLLCLLKFNSCFCWVRERDRDGFQCNVVSSFSHFDFQFTGVEREIVCIVLELKLKFCQWKIKCTSFMMLKNSQLFKCVS